MMGRQNWSYKDFTFGSRELVLARLSGDAHFRNASEMVLPFLEFSSLVDGGEWGLFLLSSVVYGEARGESLAGQRAVVETVLNRARNWHAGQVVGTLLNRWQFSCLNPTDPSLMHLGVMRADNVIKLHHRVRMFMWDLICGKEYAFSSHPTHYLTRAAWRRMQQRYNMGDKKAWNLSLMDELGTIGNHVFLVEHRKV